MKLYDRKSGLELKRGDAIETFRGVKGKLVYSREPKKLSSTGRITIECEDGGERREFFPSVINAVWLDMHFQLLAVSPHADVAELIVGEFPNLASITMWLDAQETNDEPFPHPMWPEGYDAFARDLTTDELWLLDGDEGWRLCDKAFTLGIVNPIGAPLGNAFAPKKGENE